MTPDIAQPPAAEDANDAARVGTPGESDHAILSSRQRHHVMFPIRIRLWEELKRRNLVRVAVLYLITCYVILEPVHLVVALLELPHWVGRSIILLMVLGFPVVMIFCWVYEVTPEGVRPTEEVARSDSITRETGKKLNRAIFIVMALAIAVLVFDKFVPIRALLLARHGAEAVESGEPGRAQSGVERSAAATGAGQNAAPDEHSIAVLAFADMSEKHDQEYFSDGLAEELIDELAKTPGLKVIARTSSFYFKGRQAPLAEIAGTLHVANILEGSVRKSGKRLRVTTQLMRASTGEDVWSETYDREVDDVFKVQDEIAKAVIGALKLAIQAGTNPGDMSGTRNLDAYIAFLQGRELLRAGGDHETLRAAQDAFRHAVSLDPRFADAWGELGSIEDSLADSAGDMAAMRRAEADLDKAVELGPDRIIPRVSRAFTRSIRLWDWQGGSEDLSRALAIGPNDARVQAGYGDFLLVQGRVAEAQEALRRASDLDPLDGSPLTWLGWAQLMNRDLHAARASFERAAVLSPKCVRCRMGITEVDLQEGKFDDAGRHAAQIAEDTNRAVYGAMAAHSLGRAADSQRMLGELITRHARDAAFQVGVVYAWRGEKDRAFEWLERAYRQRDGGLAGLKSEPTFAAIRDDPRFQSLVRRVGIPE